MRLEGVHHITAITGDAPRNVDFYTRVLGLRLVAKTVNQDDPSVYHLFYADEQGRPGAELTFFEYPRAIPGRAGAGMVHRIVSRVGSEEALAFWAQRLGAEGVAHERVGGAPALRRSRGPRPRARGARRRRRAAGRPSTPRSRPSSRCRASTACARTARTPSYSGIVLEQLLGATALGDDTWELRGERPRRDHRLRRAAGRAGPPERGHGPSRRVGHHRRRAPALGGAPARRRRARPRGSSTATTSTRSTSASPAACCSRSPTTAPASPSTATARGARARRSSCRRSLEPHRERIEAILTPLPDPRALRSPAR